MNDENQKLIDEELTWAIQELHTLKVGDVEYGRASESVATLAKVAREEQSAKEEAERKEQEAKSERKFKIAKLALDGAAVLIPAGLYTFFGIKSLKFEETGTFTSFFGKANLGKIFRLSK